MPAGQKWIAAINEAMVNDVPFLELLSAFHVACQDQVWPGRLWAADSLVVNYAGLLMLSATPIDANVSFPWLLVFAELE